MRDGARHACALLVTCALVAAACQPTPSAPRRRAAATRAEPEKELTLCERPARPSGPFENAEIEASFRAFADQWLERRRKRVLPDRLLEIRSDYEIQLRATGSARAPWVGTLRYCELESHCPAGPEVACTPSRRSVVNEIFRFEAGEWQY